MLRARFTFAILVQAACTDDAPPQSETETEGVAESGTMSTTGPIGADGSRRDFVTIRDRSRS